MNGLLSALFAVALLSSGDASHGGLAVVDSDWRVAPACMLEEELFRDVDDERLDSFTLLEASLVASGIDSNTDLQRYCRLFDSRQATLARTLPKGVNRAEMREQSYQVFRMLFTHGKYDLQCSSPARLLRSGDYNCVSATVLYLELMRRLGEPAVACAMPAHVRAQLIAEPTMSVETTASRWLGKAADGRRDRASRTLTDAALLGKIYYNRASAKIEAKEFAAAVRLLSIACRLDASDSAAHDNRSAAINNWAIQLSRDGERQHAESVLRRGVRLDPSYDLFEVNLRYIRGRN